MFDISIDEAITLSVRILKNYGLRNGEREGEREMERQTGRQTGRLRDGGGGRVRKMKLIVHRVVSL